MYTQFKSNDTREADRQQLRRDYASTSDPKARRAIVEAGNKIRNEDRWVKSAREAMLRETRAGRTDNARNIKEDLMKRK